MSSIVDNISNFKKVTLEEDEVLVITCLRGNLTPAMWNKGAEGIKNALSTMLLTTKIIVVDETVSFTAIKQEKSNAISKD